MFVALKGKKPRPGSNENIHQPMNDKDEVVPIFNRILFSYKKDEIMTFVATGMDLEIIILNEVNHI